MCNISLLFFSRKMNYSDVTGKFVDEWWKKIIRIHIFSSNEYIILSIKGKIIYHRLTILLSTRQKMHYCHVIAIIIVLLLSGIYPRWARDDRLRRTQNNVEIAYFMSVYIFFIEAETSSKFDRNFDEK